MMSYCWSTEAKPEHVKALASYLRETHGYDVWRDEDGSSICGKMAGATDAKMAEAVGMSHTVVVCVSRPYPTRPNCQQEAEYARSLEKDKKLDMVYVMMQQDYTTVSAPDSVEGWLRMYMGSKLWYPLWDAGQVQSTGDALAQLIGDKGKLVAAAVVPAVPWTQLQFDARDAIGKGAFGQVFKATWLPHHPKTTGSRPVAVKVLTASAAGTLGRDYAAERGRALQEAERIVQIGRRGSPVLRDLILHVYGFADGLLPPDVTAKFGLRDGEQAIGIVMRLEEGGSLEMLLYSAARPAALAVDYSSLLSDTFSKLRVLAQIARGLAELHAAGVVHGDLKPANILVDGKLPPSIIIADFGLSDLRQTVDETLDRSSLHGTNSLRGTPLYCAPETLVPDLDTGEMARASRTTDMYSFGIIAHEVLSVARPFEHVANPVQLGMLVCSGKRPPIDRLPADTPEGVKQMIQRCWDGDRAQRPTAAACLAVVEGAVGAMTAGGSGLRVARMLSPRG